MEPRDVLAPCGRLDAERNDRVEIERRGVDDPRPRRAMIEQRRGHERAGVEADRAARDEIAPAHGDEIGRAGPGADEVHRHRRSEERATAQVAPSAASRGASSRPPAPAPASAAASAILGAPNRARAAAEGVTMRSACASSASSGSGVSGHAEKARGLDEAGLAALAASVNMPPLALGRARFRERAARQRGDRLAGDAGAAADADRDEPAHGLIEPPLHDRHRRAPAGKAPDRLGMRDRDLRQLAAATGAPVDQSRLRLERHRVDDQPSAGRERVDRALDHFAARLRRRR